MIDQRLVTIVNEASRIYRNSPQLNQWRKRIEDEACAELRESDQRALRNAWRTTLQWRYACAVMQGREN